MGKFSLGVAEDNTRILPIGRVKGTKEDFDFLGFTFFNTKTRTGKYRLGVRTSKKKLKAKRQAAKAWLNEHMHRPVAETMPSIAPVIRGHCNYYGVNTKRYDVKYNYKAYDPKTRTNNYKAKWVYNLSTLTEARKVLANLQTGQRKEEDKDITLKGALELWKIKAKAQDFSPVTISNTESYMKMIYQFLPEDI